MTQVYLAIGSNISRIVSLTHAVLELRKILTDMHCSPVYESTPLHAKGPNFYNAVIVGNTTLELIELLKRTKEIESNLGRQVWLSPSYEKMSLRCLDIDILLYGEQISEEPEIPRRDLKNYDFVIKPMIDLAPSLVIPGTEITMQEISAKHDLKKLKTVTDFNLNNI